MQCEEWVYNGEKWEASMVRARRQIHSHKDLDVFHLGYTLAMKIFELSMSFPKEERYALTDQVRRSSRSVCSNLVEGFAKRRYEATLKNYLNNSLGEAEETKLWLHFALDCGYLPAEDHKRLIVGYDQVTAMLWTLMTTWQDFNR